MRAVLDLHPEGALFNAKQLMPCPFTGPKKFCARQKDDLHSVKLFFCAGTKGFEEALNAVKFFSWLKKFGQAQNILGPVKGQGISDCAICRTRGCSSYRESLCSFLQRLSVDLAMQS